MAAVLGTGAGKTVILSEVIRRYRAEHGGRVLFLVHRHEILHDAAAAIFERNPDARVTILDGTVQGRARDLALQGDVVCVNVATLGVSKKQRETNGRRAVSADAIHARLGGLTMVVYDEAHHACADTSLDILHKTGVFREDGPKLLGLSATLFREDDRDLSKIFQNQSYTKGVTDLISEGHLVEPRHMTALVEGLDLNKVGTSRMASGERDFNINELDKVMEESGSFGVVAKFVALHAADRRSLVFTPTVHSAELVSDELNKLGIKSDFVTGATPAAARKQMIEDIQNGTLQALCNVQVLTEGTDLPSVDCIVLARPTQSKGLYRQIVGRCLRRSSDKKDALVIDLVGASTRNDLANFSDLDEDLEYLEPGESFLQGVKRAQEKKAKEQEFIEQEFEILKELDPEAAAFFGPIVSGSFNLIEVDPYSEAQIRVAKFKEEKEKQERKRALSLPDFPGPKKLGPFLDIGNDTYFMSTYHYTKLPSYNKSYVCITNTAKGWVVFRCDSSKKFDKGRYDFVGAPADSYESSEFAAVSYAREFNKDSLFWESQKLNPHSTYKKSKATQPQIDLMRRLGVDKVSFELVDSGEMKLPKKGVAEDHLDLALLRDDVAKQAQSVKEYYGE